jgi:hypothetical protein
LGPDRPCGGQPACPPACLLGVDPCQKAQVTVPKGLLQEAHVPACARTQQLEAPWGGQVTPWPPAVGLRPKWALALGNPSPTQETAYFSPAPSLASPRFPLGRKSLLGVRGMGWCYLRSRPLGYLLGNFIQTEAGAWAFLRESSGVGRACLGFPLPLLGHPGSLVCCRPVPSL